MVDKVREAVDSVAKRIKEQNEKWGVGSDRNTYEQARRQAEKVAEEADRKGQR